MSKSLRRVLDRLLAAATGPFGKKTTTREGVQEPQQMHGLVPAPARSQQS